MSAPTGFQRHRPPVAHAEPSEPVRTSPAPAHIVLTVNYSPWSPYCGGGQQATHSLATAFAGNGHRVTVVYTKAPWERIPVPDGLPYEIRWATFVGLRSRGGAPLRPLNAVPVARTVAALLARGEPTILHAQGEEGALLPRLRHRINDRVRFVLTAHYPDYPQALARPTTDGPVATVRRLFVPPKFHALGLAARGADLCCVPSEASRRAFANTVRVDESRVRVVANGVESVFTRVQRRPEAVGGPLVYFGRLDHEKGVLILIEALARLGPGTPPLLVAGRGPLERAVRARAVAAGLGERVRLLGWMAQPELARLLAGARLAVLPSFVESFGCAMVEAMAAGVPLITTHTGALPEVVGGTAHALLVPPGNAPALAAAIARLLREPDHAEHMGRAARAHVLKHYSWMATARAYEDHYRELFVT